MESREKDFALRTKRENMVTVIPINISKLLIVEFNS